MATYIILKNGSATKEYFDKRQVKFFIVIIDEMRVRTN